jgi:DNA-binding GntR family transcriptional regulator
VSKRASDTAYAKIKAWILNGKIAPNSLIDERKTAERLGISRTPVREALLRLQTENLVEIARGKGIRVLALSSPDMREIYQVITGLEILAVYLLTSRRPARRDLEPLFQTVTDMEAASKSDDGEAWGDADEAFHRGIVGLSRNGRLAQAAIQLRDSSRRAHLVAVRLQPAGYRKASEKYHRDLLKLILEGDPLRALASHLEQRLRGEEALVSIVEKFNLRNL